MTRVWMTRCTDRISADQQQPGGVPAPQPVELDVQQLDVLERRSRRDLTSRSKSACFSITVTSTPPRAGTRPSIITAGPPPAMTQVVLSVASAPAGTRSSSHRIVWPGGRVPQLVGRRRTVAIRPAVRRPDRRGDARRARSRIRNRHPARWRAGQWDSATAARAPPERGRRAMSARAKWGHSPSKLGAHPPEGQGERRI